MGLSLSARAIRDPGGKLLGYEGTTEDITERKRAEEALGEIREAERRRIARDLHDEATQDLVFVLQSLQAAQLTPQDRGPDALVLEQEVAALRRAIAGLRNAVYDLRLESIKDKLFLRSVEALVELNRQMVPERVLELAVGDGLPTDLTSDAGNELLRIVQEALWLTSDASRGPHTPG